MAMRNWWKITTMAALCVSAPALSSPSAEQSLRPGSVMQTVERLKPGEYLWLPQIAPEGPVIVIVSLRTQRAIVYRNGVPIGVSTISTGKKGHETPTGIFTILQKKVEHVSNLYDAPMPYMQRLTWGGIALHAGDLPGYPASHGCIRLPTGFAKRLYGVTKLGLTVVVTDQAALPRVAPVPQWHGDRTSAAIAGAGEAIEWRPDLSPSGPISIILSAADMRVVVLRNGEEIGSAPVRIDAEVNGTSAYSLQAIGPEGMEWLRLPLPGDDGAAEQPLYRGKVTVEESFRQAVVAQLRPGATVVVTADSLSHGATGRGVTINLSEPHR
jgi:hypothetical protein